MAVGLAGYDVGIRYVAVEENTICFEDAQMRLLECTTLPIKKTGATRQTEENAIHSKLNKTFFKKSKPFTKMVADFKSSENVPGLMELRKWK